ncbi:MAG: hypothetical protein ABIT38_10995 [Gemmatimonadaceae bacterium]
MRGVLAEHISSVDVGSLARVEMLTRGFVARGADMWTARARAYRLNDAARMGQASVIAYGRTYVLSAIIILLIIPLLLLVRKTRGANSGHAIME